MIEKQKTIKQHITLKGKGLHTGAEVELTFKPAQANSGFQFVRTDIEGNPVVKAVVENVVDTSRGTAIQYQNIRIDTIEHVLASATGLGIDNLIIELNGSEVPIMDGSAKPFIEALNKAQIIELDAKRKFFVVTKKFIYKDESKGVEIVIYPDDKYSIEVLVDYGSDVLSNQFARLNDIHQFSSEIAPCKTFVFLHELEFLIKNNLIKGGDLSNALVFVDRIMSQPELDHLAKLFNKPSIEVKSQGILNNTEMTFKNEPARHKLLDIIGDLSLIGMPIKGKVIAVKPGHYSNVELAKLLRKEVLAQQNNENPPVYNLNAAPLFDINHIKKLLPHRPPFLLVDKILEMTDTRVVGLKNVTMNEGFFVGHFPDEPVMPGVLQIEAMAQVGGILVLSTVDDPENYSTYFLKVENFKFKRKVIPGDTIIFVLELVAPIRRGIANMYGRAYVGEHIVSEGLMMAQIVKNK